MSWKSWDFSLQYQDFLHLKSNFPHLKSNFPHMKSNFPQSAFYFLQRLSIFFNCFPLSSTALWFSSTAFWLSSMAFRLSEKSEKIYLRWQVYERSLFELCIFCHSLPELRNFRYNTQQGGEHKTVGQDSVGGGEHKNHCQLCFEFKYSFLWAWKWNWISGGGDQMILAIWKQIANTVNTNNGQKAIGK